MSAARVLAMLVSSAILASAAEVHGTWGAASTGGQRMTGGWTATPHADSGSITGTWSLYDAGGKVVVQGGWSASKLPKTWEGAWRATVWGQTSEYSGTFTAETPLSTETGMAQMFESALAAVVTGTWASGGREGSWSIRAYP